MKILRREIAVNLPHISLQVLLALTAMVLLIGLFSRDLTLTMIVTGGLIAVIAVSGFIAWCLLNVSRLLAAKTHGYWRLAFSNLHRRKSQNLLQIIVFSVAIMALLTLTIIRSSIMDEWSSSIPEKAPNHYLVNISPAEVDAVERMLSEQKSSMTDYFPRYAVVLLTSMEKCRMHSGVKNRAA